MPYILYFLFLYSPLLPSFPFCKEQKIMNNRKKEKNTKIYELKRNSSKYLFRPIIMLNIMNFTGISGFLLGYIHNPRKQLTNLPYRRI